MAGRYSIFVGYRRSDAPDAAGRIYDRLRSAFGAEAVFKDIDDVGVGERFGARIMSILPKCSVFLALIGPDWVNAVDENGARRLDSAEDWVRIELETALATPGLQIVPVLINGAGMPEARELPESLRPIREFNAAYVRRDPDFHHDMDGLIAALRAGVRTGRVEVEAPSQVAEGSKAAWKLIENSLDVHDYSDFQTYFPGTPEVIFAGRHKRQLEAWARVDKDDPNAIVAFLKNGAFAALEGRARQEMHRAAQEREAARVRAEAERARAEAERVRRAQADAAQARERAEAERKRASDAEAARMRAEEKKRNDDAARQQAEARLQRAAADLAESQDRDSRALVSAMQKIWPLHLIHFLPGALLLSALFMTQFAVGSPYVWQRMQAAFAAVSEVRESNYFLSSGEFAALGILAGLMWFAVSGLTALTPTFAPAKPFLNVLGYVIAPLLTPILAIGFLLGIWGRMIALIAPDVVSYVAAVIVGLITIAAFLVSLSGWNGVRMRVAMLIASFPLAALILNALAR